MVLDPIREFPYVCINPWPLGWDWFYQFLIYFSSDRTSYLGLSLPHSSGPKEVRPIFKYFWSSLIKVLVLQFTKTKCLPDLMTRGPPLSPPQVSWQVIYYISVRDSGQSPYLSSCKGTELLIMESQGLSGFGALPKKISTLCYWYHIWWISNVFQINLNYF